LAFIGSANAGRDKVLMAGKEYPGPDDRTSVQQRRTTRLPLRTAGETSGAGACGCVKVNHTFAREQAIRLSRPTRRYIGAVP
jgi:hypothetical protein